MLHRVVALEFIGGEGVVNHIDGNKTNNDISNLEIVTQKQNVRHAIETCLIKYKKGDLANAFKGTITAVCLSTGKEIKMSGTKEIKGNGFSPASVYSCVNGKRNSHKGHSFYR